VPAVPWKIAKELFAHCALTLPWLFVHDVSVGATRQVPSPPSTTLLPWSAPTAPSQNVGAPAPSALSRLTWCATDVCTNRSRPGVKPLGTVPNTIPLSVSV